MAIDFSQLEGQGHTKILYVIHQHFKKGLWETIYIALPKTFILFFISCLSNGPFTKTFTSSSKKLTIVAWSQSTCFFKAIISYV